MLSEATARFRHLFCGPEPRPFSWTRSAPQYRHSFMSNHKLRPRLQLLGSEALIASHPRLASCANLALAGRYHAENAQIAGSLPHSELHALYPRVL